MCNSTNTSSLTSSITSRDGTGDQEAATCDTAQYALSWQLQLVYVVAFVFIVVVATSGNVIVIRNVIVICGRWCSRVQM